MSQKSQIQRIGFTLVELLVVIAIIGILVALLLPAVQAAREAARRTQCTNQVKQMMLAMHNHEASKKAFPSGGIAPYSAIENYLSGPNGSPLGPDRQGLSWAYQILPYLEESAIYDLRNTDQLQTMSIAGFHCPSKRGPTRHPVYDTELMDYAAAVPAKSRTQLNANATTYIYTDDDATWGTVGCSLLEFWGVIGGNLRFEVPDIQERHPKLVTSKGFTGFLGVIVRSNYCASCTPDKQVTGFYKRVSFAQIADGSSNTFVLGEKRLAPSEYDVGNWHDDYGWKEGWDPDTLRSTICLFGPDTDDQSQSRGFGYNFGAAHPSVMIAGFADASVQPIQFSIERELLNRLGNRADGEGGDEGAF